MFKETNRDKEPELYLLNCDQSLPLRYGIKVVRNKGRASVKLHVLSYCLSFLEHVYNYTLFKKSSQII